MVREIPWDCMRANPHMEVTTVVGCRNACSYCPQSAFIAAYNKRSTQRMMGFDVFQQCVDKIPSKVRIHFTGMGEPWLNPECTRMVRYAHETGHPIFVSTTAVGMTQTDIDLLRDIPFAPFMVHLPTAERLERIIVDDAYVAVIRSLLESGVVDRWHCHSSTVHPRLQSVVGEVFHSWIQSRAGNLRVGNVAPPRRKRGLLECPRGLDKNVLLPNGDVLLCCQDFGMQHILGNLTEQDYGSLFEGPEFLSVQRGLRMASLPILCRRCEEAREVSLTYRILNRVTAAAKNVKTPQDALALGPKLFRLARR